jgi:hypothetical protein
MTDRLDPESSDEDPTENPGTDTEDDAGPIGRVRSAAADAAGLVADVVVELL